MEQLQRLRHQPTPTRPNHQVRFLTYPSPGAQFVTTAHKTGWVAFLCPH
jgi:hypothetical protein